MGVGNYLRRALDDWATTGDIQGWKIDESDRLHVTKPKKSRTLNTQV
jgi:hypothetical protein